MAIIGFSLVTQGPGQAWTTEYLSQTLANEIMADATFRLVPPDQVDHTGWELHLEPANHHSPEEIQRIGHNLGADFIAGGLLNPGNSSTPAILDLTIANTLTGQLEMTIHRTAPPGDFMALTSGLGAELRAALRPRTPSWGELPQSTPKPITEDAAVQRLYATGIERLRLFDALAAVDQLERAVALDPEAPLIRWKLAQAFLNSGDQPSATENAEAALANLDGLPREQQLSIEAFALETHHQWDDAIAKYMALQEFIPDTIDYSLRLVMTLIKAGRPEEALPVFSSLHQMAPEINGDPRIALGEAKVLLQLSRYGDSETAASAAITRATEVGASIVKASALRERAWARQKQGRMEQALEDLENSQNLFATYGHRSGEAGALSGLAGIHLEMGRLDEARDLFLMAKRIFHDIGERRSEASVLYNLAVIRANSGDIEGARSVFIETLEVKKELNDVAGQAHVYDALAQIDSALGDLAGAAGWLSRAAEGARESGDRLLEGRCIRTVGDFDRKGGDLRSAGDNYDRALEVFRQIGNPLEEGRTLVSLADLARDQEDLDAAIRHLESAETLFRSGSLLSELTTTLHTMGIIQIDLGMRDQADTALEEALSLAEDLGHEDIADQIKRDLEN
jgi:tetratricopeptide (TPR) repeat protein